MAETFTLTLTEAEAEILGFALIKALRDQVETMEAAQAPASVRRQIVAGCQERIGLMHEVRAKLDAAKPLAA